jgi:hypothetical protein
MKNLTTTQRIEWVENYFYTDGRLCGECGYQIEWKEPHGERMAACGLLEGTYRTGGNGRFVASCPALDEELEKNSQLVDKPTVGSEIDDILSAPRGIINALAISAGIGFLVALAYCSTAKADDRRSTGDQPLMLHKGISASNSAYPIVRDKAYSLTQDVDFAMFGRLRFGYLNEGHLRELKRDGLFVQLVFQHPLTSSFLVEAAVGPYVTATTQEKSVNAWQDKYDLAALVGLSARWQLSTHWVVGPTWQHPMLNRDGRDTDVFMLTLGWQP